MRTNLVVQVVAYLMVIGQAIGRLPASRCLILQTRLARALPLLQRESLWCRTMGCRYVAAVPEG